jgi:hypothetical protein
MNQQGSSKSDDRVADVDSAEVHSERMPLRDFLNH